MSKQNIKQVLRFGFYMKAICVLWLMLSPLIIDESLAQVYSFPEIKEIFLRERAQTGNLVIREECFGSIDDLILGFSPQLHPDIEGFYKFMQEKAILEIKTEIVASGATIWQIYNHGFVVKTPSTIFGCDLYDYFNTEKFLELADLIDVYFIFHLHGDHNSTNLINKMKTLGKPVVGPAEVDIFTIKMNAGDSQVIANLTVNAHFGLHSTAVRQFEIITAEGLKFLHTGDNQTSETLPQVTDVDVLMLNAWVNESGWTSHITGTRNSINKIKPKVTLPGHMLELGHLGTSFTPVTYQNVIKTDDGSLASEYYVLGWGERYHFDNSSNDSISPNIVENAGYKIQPDTVNVSWDIPEMAEDGDTASFYKIIFDNTEGIFTSNRNYSFLWDSVRTYNIKIYSYDDCGNQSENFAEINVVIPNINYPPRILKYFPTSVDTADVFTGVRKLFGVNSIDPNDDSLFYQWKVDHFTIQGATSATFPFNVSDLDSGLHQLTAIVSDQQDSVQLSWLIDYHSNFSIVDNEDSLMYSEQGSWDFSYFQAYGPTCRYTRSEPVGNWAQFLFYPEKAGKYDIFEIVPITPQVKLNDAIYSIIIDGQPLDSIHVNQENDSGNWIKIGSYDFPADA